MLVTDDEDMITTKAIYTINYDSIIWNNYIIIFEIDLRISQICSVLTWATELGLFRIKSIR